MKRSSLRKLVLAVFVVAAPGVALAARHIFSLGFGSSIVSGFPTGRVFLSGGGSYDPSTASNDLENTDTFIQAAGGFRCLEDVNQGPLSLNGGCRAGQGVRWDTDHLLESTTFKCTGAATEPLKTATTSNTTAVMVSDFYRAGDGNIESFTAQVILSTEDLDPVLPGVQNVWIQGVGCGTSDGTLNHNPNPR